MNKYDHVYSLPIVRFSAKIINAIYMKCDQTDAEAGLPETSSNNDEATSSESKDPPTVSL